MLFRMIGDLKEFLAVMLTFLLMFANMFYFRYYDATAEEYGLDDDDDAENPFFPFSNTLKTLYLLAFAGDFDAGVFVGTTNFLILVICL